MFILQNKRKTTQEGRKMKQEFMFMVGIFTGYIIRLLNEKWKMYKLKREDK